MKISELAERLSLDIKVGSKESLGREIAKGYASDLLSDVIGNAEEDDIWITLQVHQNIVAVAVMKSLAAIILIHGRQPDDAAVAKAPDEHLTILITDL